MICKQCNAEISEESKFCPSCGAKTEPKLSKKFCAGCGCEIDSSIKFCPKCGKNQIENITPESVKEQGGGKHGKSYFVSIISAIITFIIRVSMQETFYSWSNLLSNRKVVGIEEDMKPFLTIIPVAATIIVALILAKDKKSTSQEKVTAIIVNLIFIALAVLFIWFDLPYSIVDF